jgi:hypothetical protein
MCNTKHGDFMNGLYSVEGSFCLEIFNLAVENHLKYDFLKKELELALQLIESDYKKLGD